MNTLVGYARVSSSGQSLTVQLDKLADCDKIFQEKKTGTSLDKRDELKTCLDYVREGDVLVVCKLDRLARNVRDLQNIVATLDDKGVGLKILDQALDTTTNTGRLLFNMLGVIAEFENDLRKERQREGIKQALAKGVQFGVKPKLDDETIKALVTAVDAGEQSKAAIAKQFNISRSTLYRYL